MREKGVGWEELTNEKRGEEAREGVEVRIKCLFTSLSRVVGEEKMPWIEVSLVE